MAQWQKFMKATPAQVEQKTASRLKLDYSYSFHTAE